jgi:hypothetical protein
MYEPIQTKRTPWVLVRKRTIPTERPSLVMYEPIYSIYADKDLCRLTERMYMPLEHSNSFFLI